MADVRLNIAGREYLVTCRDGEEERLLTLGAIVDEKAQEAVGSASGLNESRQLLFASLLLADQIADTPNTDTHDVPAPSQDHFETIKAVETLEKLADRIEAVADKLEP